MLARAVGIFACLIFLLVVIGITLGSLAAESGDCPGKKRTPCLTTDAKLLFPMPALVLEFVGDGRGLQEIVVNIKEQGAREKLQSDLRFDSLFITLYLLLFAGIALVLAGRGGVWVWVALAAVACSVGAAAWDGVENLAMARAVERYDAAPVSVAAAGFLKWAFSFAALALLAFTFRGRGFLLADLLFWLALGVAALGAVGLLVLKAWPARMEFRPLQLAFVLMLWLILLVGIAFWRHPDKFRARQ